MGNTLLLHNIHACTNLLKHIWYLGIALNWLILQNLFNHLGLKVFGTEFSQCDGKALPHPAEVVFSLDIFMSVFT